MTENKLPQGCAAQISNVSKLHCSNLFIASRYAIADMFRFSDNASQPLILRDGEEFVLSDVSFQVRTNEFFGILGGPGSGKSTLASVLSGLHLATSGSINFRTPPLLLSHIGSGLRPMLSITENARFKAALSGISREAIPSYIKEVLRFSELQEKASYPLFNLSSQEMRHFSLALALLTDSEILIFDNVLPSGSPEVRERYLALIKELKGRRTIIFITSKPAILDQFADRVLLLNDGRNVMVSSPVDAIATYQQLILPDEDLASQEDFNSDDIQYPEDELDILQLDEDYIASDKKKPTMELSSLEINGHVQSSEPSYWFWLEKGEHVEIKLKLKCNSKARYTGMRLVLHSPLVNLPIAEQRFSKDDLSIPKSNYIDLQKGAVLTLAFNVLIPELPASCFRLSLNLIRRDKIVANRRDIFKLLHFGVKNGTAVGQTSPLSVSNFSGKIL